MATMNGNEHRIRKLLLDFYSSELNSHSRLIIGLSVIDFTLLQVIYTLTNPQVYSPITWWQYCFVFFSLGFVSAALWYLIMRYCVYGILCNSVLTVDIGQNIALSDALIKVRDIVLTKNKVFDIIPSCLFVPCGSKTRITRLQKIVSPRGTLILGVILSVVLGVATTILFSVLLGLWRI